jgi:hypothetical protein
MRHSRIRSPTKRAAVAILATSLLAGCTTAAQRQYETIRTGNQAVAEQAKTCAAELANSPEAAPLQGHAILNPTAATLAQLSDPALATPSEIAAINQLYPRYKTCQQAMVAGLSRTMPSVAPILGRSVAASDDANILLVQRKMPWGRVDAPGSRSGRCR